MKQEYTYEFANGDKVTIRIEKALCEQLEDLDRKECNNNKAEKRRHVSLDALNRDESLIASSSDIISELDRQDLITAVDNAINQLEPSQQELIQQLIFSNVKQVEIARKEGVSRAAINLRLQRALLHLRSFFGEDR